MADPGFELSIILGVVFCGLLMLWVLHSSSRWHRDPKSGARLPKGSFSWPIIGDTIGIDKDPLSWGISQQKRYGKIFMANIFFRKSIVGTTPEFAKFVLQNSDLFKLHYPKTYELISPISMQGPRHLIIKKIYNKTLALPEYLQGIFKSLEGIIFENLASWEQEGTVNGREAVERLTADTASYVAFGAKNFRSTPQGILALESFLLLIEGLGALPVNFPGTTYNKALKAKAVVRSYVRDMLAKRRIQEGTEITIFQALVEAHKDPQAKGAPGVDLDDDLLVDDAIGAWFGSYKTNATTLTWTLKYLVDHPEVFRRVQAEQLQILEGKDLSVPGPRLTWIDTKKMVYTSKFFLELQRVLSIAYMLPRVATQDIVFEGVFIPKGWQVIPMLNLLHENGSDYPDPQCFNPDRFDAPPKPNTYMPFGSGAHRCPGDELAKVVTLIYIHYLTTMYTYDPVGPDLGASHKIFPILNGGYPINVRRRI